MAPPMFVLDEMFWVELVFSLVIIVSCLLIYIKTREIYELSSYKGIKYFRSAFLFFGIAFFARFFLRLFALIGGPGRFDQALFNLGFLIFLYAGLMAGFFLLYSSVWKQFKEPEQFKWLVHPLAAAIAAVFIIFFFGPETLVILGIIFLLAAVFAYSGRRRARKRGIFKGLHIDYMLLFASFFADSLAHFFIRISVGTSIILYALSSFIFLVILYRVVKSTERYA